MTAASYWSLLAPAIEMAEQSGSYGDKGQWAFIPVAIGFIMGAAFVYGADLLLPYMVGIPIIIILWNTMFYLDFNFFCNDYIYIVDSNLS